MKSVKTPLRVWRYPTEEWNRFIAFERRDKLEYNILYGLGNALLVSIVLLYFSDFVPAVDIGIGLLCATLFGLFRMLFAYPYLKKNDKNREISIFDDSILINQKKFKLKDKKRYIKSANILVKKNNLELLEFKIQKFKGAPVTKDHRALIPNGKRDEAQKIIETLT